MKTIFLGAGASKAFGYPTTLDFMKVFAAKFSGHPNYKDVFEFINSKNRQLDIEVVLWDFKKFVDCIDLIQEPDTFKRWFFIESNRAHYLMHSRNDSLVSVLQQQKGIIKNFVSEINRLVYDTYWQEPDEKSQNYYQMLFREFRDNEINIFTTNYDLVIERAFDSNMDNFTDGFKPLSGRGFYWDFDNYKSKRFKLYKLHGSINWKRQQDGKVYHVPVHDFTKHEDHVILYPGFKGIPEEEPFKTMHSYFEKSLISSEECFFVGFSFRDEYINEIISRAITKNPKLKLIVWNPEKPNLVFPQDNTIFFEERFGEDFDTIPRMLKQF